MQKTRPVAERRRHAKVIAQQQTHALQDAPMRLGRRQIGLQSHVVARPDAGEQSPHGRRQVVVADRRRGRRPWAPMAGRAAGRRHQGAQQTPGGVLALLHVGLIERIDVEHRPGGRHRDLPAHELGAHVPDVGQGQASSWGARRRSACSASAVRASSRPPPQGDEHAVRRRRPRAVPAARRRSARGRCPPCRCSRRAAARARRPARRSAATGRRSPCRGRRGPARPGRPRP